MNILLVVGSNAPAKGETLQVERHYNKFAAYWLQGYCGCEDCHCIVGWGKTPSEAIADYWEQWEDRQ